MIINRSLILRFVFTIICSTLPVISGLQCSKSKDAKSTNSSTESDGKGLIAQFPREQTLYVGGFQWGAPQSFNPLAVTPAWPITGNMNLIYEAMFGYNLLDGKLKGILGKSYVFKGKILHIDLHQEAKWQNGDSLTADDVVYTFFVHKRYLTNFNPIWNNIINVKAVDRHSIDIELNEKEYNPLMVLDVIAGLPILPKKIFEQIENDAVEQLSGESGVAPGNADILNLIRDFKNDKKPVGSGPYTLEMYSDDKIALKRVDNYWGEIIRSGKKAAPMYIVHSSYTGNDKFNLALQQGNLDISQTFYPQIWDKFKDGVGTWYAKEPYYIPGSIPALLMGLSKPPFDNAAFRKAVAHSINYEQIKTSAVYGYTPDLQPGLILPFGAEKEFFSAADIASFGKMYDPQKAREILKSAGYSWGSDSMLIDPSGKKIQPLFATCPAGWTDWEETIKIAVTGMRAIGIDVREKFLDYSVWDQCLKNGLFDFTMKTQQAEQAASLPWSRFDQVMTSKDYRPVGEVMYRNEGRYRNAEADRLLAQIPKTSDPTELKKLYSKLNILFMNEMPIIPLMYRPWLFYQFSTKHWTNFPTENNPYAAPQCLMVGAGVEALWGIVPVSK